MCDEKSKSIETPLPFHGRDNLIFICLLLIAGSVLTFVGIGYFRQALTLSDLFGLSLKPYLACGFACNTQETGVSLYIERSLSNSILFTGVGLIMILEASMALIMRRLKHKAVAFLTKRWQYKAGCLICIVFLMVEFRSLLAYFFK